MTTTASTPSNATASSCLFYHDESNPHLILRPTAPAIAWNRLKPATGVQELSLVGLSFYHVLDKILPAWRTTDDDSRNDGDDGGNPDDDITSAFEKVPGIAINNSTGALRLQKLHVLSTELWVASHLRSRFSLGVDRVLASLLSSPRCHNLRTISIHKACSHKMEEDWKALAQALRHLPLLESLELCDAANYYPEQEDYWNHDSDEDEVDEMIAPMARGASPPTKVDLSSLFHALTISKCPLETLKLHLNGHMKGRIPVSAWCRFWKRVRGTLKYLSLHMLTMTECEPSPDEDCSMSTTHGGTSSFRSSKLEQLHLTLVHFDSSATWKSVVLDDLLPRKTSYNTSLKALSCVFPSLQPQHYRDMWTRLFQDGCYCHLQSLAVDMGSVYDLVKLKRPNADETKSNNHSHNSTSSNLFRAQRRLDAILGATISHLLTVWRERQPVHLQEVSFPTSHSFVVAQEVARLYQGLAKANVLQNAHTLKSALEFWDSHHEEHGIKQEDASLDCIFHFVSYCGPALLSSRSSSAVHLTEVG